MQERIEYGGQIFNISHDGTPQQRTAAMQEVQKICAGCGSGQPLKLTPATCPASIVQGTIKPVNVTITSLGTSPYRYRWIVDGVVVKPWSAFDPATSFSFNHTFSETVASHVYRLEVEDSCVPAMSDFSQCTLSITAVCPSVSCAFTIPT